MSRPRGRPHPHAYTAPSDGSEGVCGRCNLPHRHPIHRTHWTPAGKPPRPRPELPEPDSTEERPNE